jgi:tRNA(Arg) A34 adenosine deaminase TadA
MADSLDDDRHLLAAIRLSEQAAARGNYPFGAVLTSSAGEAVLQAENTAPREPDCTGHAELNLVRAATRRFDPDYLATCTLYSSAEPCAMCAGAIYWGNIRRVVFALSRAVLGEVVGDAHEILPLQMSCREVFARGGHPVDVSGPHREAEARIAHERFWSAAKEGGLTQ